MTEAEIKAQDWHDVHRAEHHQVNEYGSCWCCCMVYCELNNPYYPEAMKELKISGKS